MALNPQQIADKWSQRLAASVPEYTAGVQAVTENPAQKAIAAKDKMVQRWNAAINDGKWEAGLNRVSLSDWKQVTLEKGAQRLQSGAVSGKSKVAEFMQEFMPYVDNVVAQLDGMPDLTIEDSVARSAFVIRELHKFRRS